MNKVALVNNAIEFGDKKMTLDGKTIAEGDEITLNVEIGKPPAIYLGYVSLLYPNFKANHLYNLLELLDKYTRKIKVLANAEQDEDARTAFNFKADGIGLCRTEHMFFQEDRLSHFVRMLISDSETEKEVALEKIESLQQADFENLFKLYEKKPVTIRLLDAPLHEFFPKNEDEFQALLNKLNERGANIREDYLRHKFDLYKEQNPMLGHRGCRMGITRPEIYHMQVRSIMKAACKVHKLKMEIQPRIMVPIVMMPEEMRFLRNGKMIEGTYIKGIVDIVEETLKDEGLEDAFKPAIGCMIEIPSAAIYSEALAQYCDFFSYGTNDLTQTTLGLSRDDSTVFFGDYSRFDIMVGNPFSELQPAVKEMILFSAKRARMRRPNIKLSICGEHGGDPINTDFFVENRFDSVSCSPYNIPIIKLALAQREIASSTA